MLRPVVKLCCTLLLASSPAAFAQQYTISTVAGGAPPATPASAVNTAIGQPHKVTAAGSNLYFSSGNSVFKLDSGTLTLIAGNSRAGFGGDGGPAVNAQLIRRRASRSIQRATFVRTRSTTRCAWWIQGHHHHVRRQRHISIGFWGDTGAATDANLHPRGRGDGFLRQRIHLRRQRPRHPRRPPMAPSASSRAPVMRATMATRARPAWRVCAVPKISRSAQTIP